MTTGGNSIVTLQLISDQSALAAEIMQQTDITCEQVHFLNAPGEWRSRSAAFDVTLLDMRAQGNTSEDAIKHIHDIKSRNSAHAVIMMGDSESLVSLLESDVQPLLFRVFSNAISTRQVIAAIRSAGDLHKSEYLSTPQYNKPAKNNSGVVTNVIPKKKPVSPVVQQSPPPATVAAGASNTAPLVVAEPLPEDEFYALFNDENSDEAPVVNLLKDANDDSIQTATQNMPKNGADQEILDDDDKRSSIGQAPFLIFATVGMPSLALIAYLFLWDNSPQQSGARDLLVQNSAPAEKAVESATANSPATQDAKAEPDTVTPAPPTTTTEPDVTQLTEEKINIAEPETGAKTQTYSEPLEKGSQLAEQLIDSIKTVSDKVVAVVTDSSLLTFGNADTEELEPRVQTADLSQLLAWGDTRAAEGRWIEPKENNALYYYEATLRKSSNNSAAKNGRFRALKHIEDIITRLVQEQDYLSANEQRLRFEYSHPNHSANRRLLAILRGAIDGEVAAVHDNPNGDVDAVINLLNQLGNSFAKTRNNLIKLKNERLLLAEIDRAIETGILLPPDPRNAFDRIMRVRNQGAVNPKQLNNRALAVSQRLYQRAEVQLAQQDITAVDTALQALVTLNVDHTSIHRLKQLIASGEQTTVTTEQTGLQSESAETEVITGEKVAQAKVLHIVEPVYPAVAEAAKVEGWVELSFVVDELGGLQDLTIISQEPGNMFADAAIEAVRQWQFQPAHDQIARANVASNFSVRLDFTLPQ